MNIGVKSAKHLDFRLGHAKCKGFYAQLKSDLFPAHCRVTKVTSCAQRGYIGGAKKALKVMYDPVQ